ncbi:MAG: hypothetical protein NC344_09375 [Bacteroidales bacterium]|nr:hypothetical protein [Bacteroidales bacterium]MCM1148018.1 hypothetical protein [Bacteroidales bacterium]MCM1206836.1 hypothetical protein [Bacillota bacterium]MCM1511026.1 hypothetical protein [Clostridium sp.]
MPCNGHPTEDFSRFPSKPFMGGDLSREHPSHQSMQAILHEAKPMHAANS